VNVCFPIQASKWRLTDLFKELASAANGESDSVESLLFSAMQKAIFPAVQRHLLLVCEVASSLGSHGEDEVAKVGCCCLACNCPSLLLSHCHRRLFASYIRCATSGECGKSLSFRLTPVGTTNRVDVLLSTCALDADLWSDFSDRRESEATICEAFSWIERSSDRSEASTVSKRLHSRYAMRTRCF
jgi:hypothetical protein